MLTALRNINTLPILPALLAGSPAVDPKTGVEAAAGAEAEALVQGEHLNPEQAAILRTIDDWDPASASSQVLISVTKAS